MRISHGQKKNDKFYWSKKILSGVFMKYEKRGGWAIQEFSNMLMRISEGQKKNDKFHWGENFLSGVLMKCEKRGGWAIQGFKIMLMGKSKGQRTSGWSVLKFKNTRKEPTQARKYFMIVNLPLFCI